MKEVASNSRIMSVQKILARTVFVRIPSTILWEQMKNLMEEQMRRGNIKDEIQAIVFKKFGWEITFGKLSTVYLLIGAIVCYSGKSYHITSVRTNFLYLTLSSVSLYLTDDDIIRELEKLDFKVVGDMERIRVGGIENGVRQVVVISDFCSVPERIFVEFEDEKESIVVTYKRQDD